MYRLLRTLKMNQHRQGSNPSHRHSPETFTACGPNQIWSWDITYLPSTVKGQFFYLYMVMDLYSRKAVACQVYESESGEFASDLITDACFREKISKDQVILHSDNGSPMKSATMLAKLQDLGIMPSFSRPSVSNDNPFSESLFRTLKYRPNYPEKPFENVIEARAWADNFVVWYNTVHLHSSINFITFSFRIFLFGINWILIPLSEATFSALFLSSSLNGAANRCVSSKLSPFTKILSHIPAQFSHGLRRVSEAHSQS